MTQIIIATHHSLADGFKSTLEYIAPGLNNVHTINAYLDNRPIELDVEEVMNNIPENENIIVFTDLLGGSVNQEFTKYLSKREFYLISGTNFPILLSLALKSQTEDLTPEDIDIAIRESREQLVYVNKLLSSIEMEDEDE